ncbi:probable ATP-dependent RNA helicase DDX4 isoform X2 [Rhinatrema bivittatum]|uniref:probable ATP-dependent RNA helicase DDX4 isoform X2 n=1 Tax=Rhinatrema bivittatum TaxID=194408 RepID=UPI0011268BF0|nr:probable ATP-dependent RNA helicase DDX4 isoform X2 [Rhinatrema bivittatum]
MCDEDWDNELAVMTPQPSLDYSFGKDSVNRDPLNHIEPSNQGGSSGFAKWSNCVPRHQGYTKKDMNQEQNRNQPSRGGFGPRRSFGSVKDSDETLNKRDEPSIRGFGARKSFGNKEDNQNNDQPQRFGGFSRRGGFGEENTNSDARRGFGGGRGGRGGFGQRRNNENGDGGQTFGSSFVSRRTSGSQFGGYRGRDEDIGSESAKARLKLDEDKEGIENTGPKVTYVPPPPPDTEDAIFAHYQTGINFDKYDEILVDVSGDDPPPAILTFEEAALCDTLNKNIMKAGYSKLTPVQKYSIPIILAGRDLMACAQTGSGKTAAFLLPILAHMMREGIAASKYNSQQEPEAIIIAPTRELINQIFLEARKFAYGTCVRPVVVYGGTQTGHSIRQIMEGCNILCATPGRLMDMINREKIGLRKVKYLVLDEADRMLDMGFGEDMRKLISAPGMPPKEQRQTLMFSATYPESVQRLAANYLRQDYLFVVVGQVGGACSDVHQTILQVDQYDKKDKLVEFLQNIGNERTLVFVDTKKKADYIATLLCQEHIPTTSIHGDREQKEREEALGDFRSGKCPVLVATNVAARGLDIENVQHVINFDIPSNIDEYVHRIGRTGRCGNIGKAISFFESRDADLAPALVKVLSDANQEVPSWLEEIAFSSRGISNYSARGAVFASVDARKGGIGNKNYNTEQYSSTTFEEETWG